MTGTVSQLLVLSILDRTVGLTTPARVTFVQKAKKRPQGDFSRFFGFAGRRLKAKGPRIVKTTGQGLEVREFMSHKGQAFRAI
jgi:hypothetical protein